MEAAAWAEGEAEEIGSRSGKHNTLFARAQVTVLQWRGSTVERGNPEGCEGGKGVYG